MNQPHRSFYRNGQQIDEALDVGSPSQSRIEFACPQGAVARTIENCLETILIEEAEKTLAVFGIAGHDITTAERPIVVLADADYLAGVFGLKIVERVVARDTGNAGD
jgi:hypothetical protein